LRILRLPPRARLIYMPGDDQPSREFVLKRRLLGAILLGAGLLALLVATFLSTYTVLLARSAHLSRVQKQLREANDQLATVRDINRELERSRRMQDQVLDLLGVAPPGEPGRAGGARPGADRGATPAGVPAARTAAAGPPAGPAGATATGRAIGSGMPGALPHGGLIATPPPDAWPVGGYVTREFSPPRGERGASHPGHAGIDIVAPLDTPVRSAGKGLVTAAAWDNFLGNYVEITHGLGYVTVYGHCSRLAVREGDRVDRGQDIAFLGGTGQASAPHLHFEVWKDGKAIDPRLAIAGDPPR